MLIKLFYKIKGLLWRLLVGMPYDLKSNKIRNDVAKSIYDNFSIDDYIYIGYGSVLKFYRDKNLKNQDIDIVVSRKIYESEKFNIFLKSLNATSWLKYYAFDQIKIHKFKSRGAPIEIFVSDINDGYEVSYHGLTSEKLLICKKIKKQTLKHYKFNGTYYTFPADILQYILTVYGDNWNHKIPTWKFSYKDTNKKTLIFQKGTWKLIK